MKRLIFKYDILTILMLYYFTSSPRAKKNKNKKQNTDYRFWKRKKE